MSVDVANLILLCFKLWFVNIFTSDFLMYISNQIDW